MFLRYLFFLSPNYCGPTQIFENPSDQASISSQQFQSTESKITKIHPDSSLSDHQIPGTSKTFISSTSSDQKKTNIKPNMIRKKNTKTNLFQLSSESRENLKTDNKKSLKDLCQNKLTEKSVFSGPLKHLETDENNLKDLTKLSRSIEKWTIPLIIPRNNYRLIDINDYLTINLNYLVQVGNLKDPNSQRITDSLSPATKDQCKYKPINKLKLFDEVKYLSSYFESLYPQEPTTQTLHYLKSYWINLVNNEIYFKENYQLYKENYKKSIRNKYLHLKDQRSESHKSIYPYDDIERQVQYVISNDQDYIKSSKINLYIDIIINRRCEYQYMILRLLNLRSY